MTFTYLNEVTQLYKGYHLLLDCSLDAVVGQVLLFVELKVVGGDKALLLENKSVEHLQDLFKLVQAAHTSRHTGRAADDGDWLLFPGITLDTGDPVDCIFESARY